MKMTIALGQISAGENKEENIQKGLQFMEKAADKGAQIICYPEISFDRFFPQFRNQSKFFNKAEPIPGPMTDIFSKKARELKMAAIINLLEKAAKGLHYDTSPVINSKGEILGKTRMMHIADMPGFHEKFYYNEGDVPFPVYKIAGIKVGVCICYDRHYPEYIRGLILKGAQIIFIPQAGVVDEPQDMFKIEMQAAAFGNQVYICLVNRVGAEETLTFAGESFIVDPHGKIIVQAGRKDELLVQELDLTEIKKVRKMRPYLRDFRPEIYKFLMTINH